MAKTREVLTLAVEIGDLLLRNGAEVYRVEDTVMHILTAFDIKDCDVYVLSNGIFASANENTDDACSMIRHVPLGSVHLGRIAALNQLSRELCAKECSLEEAWERLPYCKTIPIASNVSQIFFCGLGSGGFAYLFGGTALDALMAFIIGAVLQIFLIWFKKQALSKFITNILGSGLVTTLSLMILTMGIPILYDKVIIGAIMPLVPGIALTTSIRDLFNGDYVSGTIHLMDALLTAFCIAVGVGTIITLYQYVPGGVIL
ncbi:MAG: threonine/serine exporter family protein [Lachnospiraceae bacterium]|nr:threonine/serine exporter family protein [Lachnospiraceae bacterium]